MDDEFQAFVFMAFGLGFFIFVIWIVLSSDRESYNRRINEMREFGYDDVIKRDPPPKKRLFNR